MGLEDVEPGTYKASDTLHGGIVIAGVKLFAERSISSENRVLRYKIGEVF